MVSFIRVMAVQCGAVMGREGDVSAKHETLSQTLVIERGSDGSKVQSLLMVSGARTHTHMQGRNLIKTSLIKSSQ